MTTREEHVDVLMLGGEVRPYQGATTLKRIFEQQAKRTPLNTALEDAEGKQVFTYGELDNCANLLANVLRNRYSVGPGAYVCLAAERTVETMVALLAILKAGGAYVPLGMRLPEARLRLIVEDVSPSVILCSEEYAGFFSAFELNPLYVVRKDDLHCDRASNLSFAAESDPPNGDDLAYILFTSGTTGAPKGVMVSHIAVARYIDAMSRIISPAPDDRVIQIMELTVDSSIFDIWMAWGFGGTLVLCEQWTALEGLGHFIRSRNITCLGCTPTQLGIMSPAEVPSLRIAAIGGEVVPPRLIQDWARYPSCKIYNQYGPTEATVTVTSVHCTTDMPYPKSIGYANPGSAKLYILDGQGRPAPVGTPGELCIAGPQLAQGYFKQPELTAEKFARNPFATSTDTSIFYRTGDRCCWLPDGSIEYLGRLDSQVKLRGFRIELGEIEHQVLRRKDIRACAVVLWDRNNSARGSFLCAYIVAEKPAVPVDIPGLRNHLATHLPDHMVPAAFVTLPAIPTNTSGKTDRNRLPEPEAHHFVVANRNIHETRTPLQDKLASLFAEVLGVEPAQFGSSESFFHLGGQSVAAARLLGLIRQEFGIRLRFTEFFADPTLAYVAERVEAGRMMDEKELVLGPYDRQSGQLLPLSSAQSRMYFLNQLEPDSSAYNMCATYDLHGAEVDGSHLENTFRVVIERHEILRSSYDHRSGGLFQTVSDPFKFSLSELDLRDIKDASERQRRADEAISAASLTPFSLENPNTLPIRVLLVRLESEHYRLVITSHHIAMDGLSWNILFAEISAAYANAPLPPLPIQYGDFCLWESAFMRSDTYREQLAYWEEHLGQDPEALRLPTDRPRPPVWSGAGAGLSRTFIGLAEPLRRVAAVNETTPFAVLLAAYFGLLHRLGGQREIIVGILSSGRSQPATDSLIGMFVNTLPIKIELGPDTAFSTLLAPVKHAIGAAFDHQDVPFENIVKQVVHSRVPGQAPLVQTMLTMDVYDENGADTLALNGLEITELDAAETTTSMFDFSIGCSLGPEADLFVDAEYATDLFDEPTVALMVGQFERILRSAFSNPETVLSELDITGNWKEVSRLPALEPVQSTVSGKTGHTFVEPRTTEEVRLAAIFCDVLGLPRVSIDDSFFALGGDSLLSFQLIARARRFGYFLNVTQIMEYQTVEHLAAFLLSAASFEPKVEKPEEKVEAGVVDLTPIQQWFFKERFPVPSHYNQSRMLVLRRDIDERLVHQALLALICHHDALRFTYQSGSSTSSQFQHGEESAAPFLAFRSVDHSASNPIEGAGKIEREAERTQTSLDIEMGPVVAATLIRRSQPLSPVLFLVIHHLIVDEVSWAIILDDLDLAYSQLMAGSQVELPPKSHSFSQWSSALRKYSNARSLMGEIPYWRYAEASSFRLPTVNRPHATTNSTASLEDEIACSHRIVGIDRPSFSFSVRDLFVAALVWSLANWESENRDVCILLEGHGREDVVAEGFDLSRTVGWFTSVFPVRFDLTGVVDAKTALRAAIEQLNRVPGNGIGYGLLKYPFSGASLLSNRHASPVTFNYLGRSSETLNHTPINTAEAGLVVSQESELPCGSDWNPLNLSDDSILDVSCYLIGDRIEMSWQFNTEYLNRQSVAQLVADYTENLKAMTTALLRDEVQLGDTSVLFVRTDFERAVAAVWEKHQQHDSFHGMAAGIVVGGKPAFATGYGFRDASRTVPVDEHTSFSLGSVGKPFVSLLAAALADEGIIDLDEPLVSLLEYGLPEIYGRMTLRQLFCMTAGIPYVDTGVEERVDDLFEICRTEIKIEHEPGTRYFYSNFSYALAGYILALSVASDSGLIDFETLPALFVELMNEKVFATVGMDDAESEGWQFLAKNRATLGPEYERGAIGSAVMLPSGAVKASAADTARFLISEFNHGVSSSGRRIASDQRVAERFNVEHSLGYDWGMGWFWDRTHKFLHISGQWADAVSGLRLDLDTGLGMSFMLSVDDSAHWQFMEMDMDRLFIDLLGKLR